MIIGIPSEVKSDERKIFGTPSLVKALIAEKHKVFVQSGAGEKAGFADSEYVCAGAEILSNAKEVWCKSDFIIKVNSPVENEYEYLRPGMFISAFFDFVEYETLMPLLLEKKITAINPMRIKLADGNFPVATIGSEIVGKAVVRIASQLSSQYSGGMLLGGITGVAPAKFTILGAGTVGRNAAVTAARLGIDVTVLDTDVAELRKIENMPGRRIKTLFSNRENIETVLTDTDVLICAVKTKNKTIIKENDVKSMKKGSIIIDAGLVHGSIVETLDRITDSTSPCFEKYGVIHYSYADITSTVAKTVSSAIAGVILPYILEIAKYNDITETVRSSQPVMNAVITYKGHITNEREAEMFGETTYELSMYTGI